MEFTENIVNSVKSIYAAVIYKDIVNDYKRLVIKSTLIFTMLFIPLAVLFPIQVKFLIYAMELFMVLAYINTKYKCSKVSEFSHDASYTGVSVLFIQYIIFYVVIAVIGISMNNLKVENIIIGITIIAMRMIETFLINKIDTSARIKEAYTEYKIHRDNYINSETLSDGSLYYRIVSNSIIRAINRYNVMQYCDFKVNTLVEVESIRGLPEEDIWRARRFIVGHQPMLRAKMRLK